MNKKNVLVTGAKGQLGNEMQIASKRYDSFRYFFTDVDELDICDKETLNRFVTENTIHYIINCAAYTAVDKAEEDIEHCYQINKTAVANIAQVARDNRIKVVHVSTDYVFDGTNYIPYTELMPVSPSTVYGKSKLEGENILFEMCKQAVVIRTSWLYSSFGNNFVKTMMKLGAERDTLNVVFDQVGTPTCAADLADAIFRIIEHPNFTPGVYHYSNEGVCSWYDFTKSIHRIAGISCHVLPIESKDYPAKTPRPHYSVLNKTKIKKQYDITIPHWEESLEKCISILKRN